MLVPLTAAAVGFLEGAMPGSVFGVTAGLFSALTLGPGHARFIWCDCAIGILCGATVNKALGRTFHGYLLCAAYSSTKSRNRSAVLLRGRFARTAR